MRPKSLILLAPALGCGLVASIGISQVLDGSNRPAAVENGADLRRPARMSTSATRSPRRWSRLEEWPKDKVPVGRHHQVGRSRRSSPPQQHLPGRAAAGEQVARQGRAERPDPRRAGWHAVEDDLGRRSQERGGIAQPWRSRRRSDLCAGDIPNMASTARSRRSSCKTSASTRSIRPSTRRRTARKPRNVAKTVSLIVTPARASRINLAENMGEISLIPAIPTMTRSSKTRNKGPTSCSAAAPRTTARASNTPTRTKARRGVVGL